MNKFIAIFGAGVFTVGEGKQKYEMEEGSEKLSGIGLELALSI